MGDHNEAADVAAETTVSVVLHVIGHAAFHAAGALLSLIIDVVQIPGDVQVKPVEEPPADPKKTGPFLVACGDTEHSDSIEALRMDNGMWVFPACLSSQDDAEAKGKEHGEKNCPSNGSKVFVMACAEIEGKPSSN